MSKIADLPEPAAAEEAGAQQSRKSGRAVFSDDGRSIWEWQTSTGVFSQNITDEQLGRLEAPHLELVERAEPVQQRVSERPSRAAPKAAAPARAKARPVEKGALRRLLGLVAGNN